MIRRRLPLALEAVWFLAMWRLLLWLRPFREVVGRLRPLPDEPRFDPSQLAQITWAVRAAARLVPWRCVCFDQGLAAFSLLRRRGIAAELHYGIARSTTGAFDAHVWVTSGGKPVVGTDDVERFTRMATFPARESGFSCVNPEQYG